MKLIIATRRNMYNAFGIRSNSISQQLNKYCLEHNIDYKIIILDTFALLDSLKSYKAYRSFDILFLTPSNDLKNILHEVKRLSSGKVMYSTASIGVWEKPQWAIDIREQFDVLFIGCSGTKNFTKDKFGRLGYEFEYCQELGLNYYYTPFGIEYKLFEDIKYEDKIPPQHDLGKISVLLEDSNKGKDNINPYVRMIEKYYIMFKVYNWDFNRIGKEECIRFGKQPFYDQPECYRKAKFFLNGIPQMQKAVEQSWPNKPFLKHMAIYDNRILEAMASGCVVVSFENTMQNDLLKCPWLDYESYIPNIELPMEIIDDYDAVYEDIKNCGYGKSEFDSIREHAKKYDWRIMFEKYWLPAFRDEGLLDA